MRAAPTPTEAGELTNACTPWFGPCCSPQTGRICPAHLWLLDDPTRRGLVKQWQRLLWMRTQRAALCAGEGADALVATPDPTKLPW